MARTRHANWPIVFCNQMSTSIVAACRCFASRKLCQNRKTLSSNYACNHIANMQFLENIIYSMLLQECQRCHENAHESPNFGT